jgi:hypothetical protein
MRLPPGLGRAAAGWLKSKNGEVTHASRRRRLSDGATRASSPIAKRAGRTPQKWLGAQKQWNGLREQ